MKNSKIKIGLFFSILILFSMAACNPDENEDIDQRDKFIGTWNCAETSTENSNTINFSVTISKDSLTENEIFMANFYLLGFDQKSRLIVNYSNLTFPQQVVCNKNVSGSGTYSNNKVNLTYYVNDNADIDTVNAVLSK